MKKICLTCNQEKDLDIFSIKSKSKDGYKNSCKNCDKEYRKRYYDKNKELELIRNKKYNFLNEEKIYKKQNEYKKINEDKIVEYQKTYRSENSYKHKEYIKLYHQNTKKERCAKIKLRKQNDPLFKLTCSIRGAISKSIKRNGFAKNKKTEMILGCSFEQFKQHIESNFEPWMSWENRGLYNGKINFGWDIDHIIPVSTGKTEEELLKLNHYTNLQPLCSYTNRDVKKDIY